MRTEKESLKGRWKAERTSEIAFMSGSMSEARYDNKEYSRRIEEAIEMGASIFQTSFPRNKSLADSVRRFAQEIIPSFNKYKNKFER